MRAFLSYLSQQDGSPQLGAPVLVAQLLGGHHLPVGLARAQATQPKVLPPPQKPHPREMAAKPTDPSPSSPPSPSGGVCAPGLPLCRQQVEYCRCGRLKCRRHNGGLCPIRHARAPLWKAHTRGDTALAPAIMPAA